MVIILKKILFLGLLILIFFIYTNKLEEPPKIEIDNEDYYHVSLFAVGDNLIHNTIYESAYVNGTYDFIPIYKEVKPLIRQYDLKFINQETILGGKEIGLSTYPAFNSPHELGDALVDAGFNLISIANNHTLDRGEKAILSAINYLDSKAVIYSGAVKSENMSHVKLFNLKGIKFAFVAYTYGTNGIAHPGGKEYLANVYSNSKARNDIIKIRDLVDVVIVSMHWGEEYQEYPSTTQKEQAKYLSENGVDIIIGHHPHVIQPIDIINSKDRDTLVIYSLGNFLSDQKGIDRLVGMGVGVDLYKGKKSEEISLKNLNATLFYRYKDNNNTFKIKLYHDLNNDYLNDYLLHFENKSKLIKTYNKNIEVK